MCTLSTKNKVRFARAEQLWLAFARSVPFAVNFNIVNLVILKCLLCNEIFFNVEIIQLAS